MKIAIIGLGLMGGSIATSAKQKNIFEHIAAYDTDLSNLKKAYKRKIIDSYHNDIKLAIKDADIIFIATPVATFESIFTEIKKYITKHQIVTDVGSAKVTIIKSAQKIFAEHIKQFVPSHPLVGSEKSGVEAAVENLLGGKAATKHSRKPEIVADAAYMILTQPSRECTGNFFIDDEVLIEHGITDLSGYSVVPGEKLMPDFFLYGGDQT